MQIRQNHDQYDENHANDLYEESLPEAVLRLRADFESQAWSNTAKSNLQTVRELIAYPAELKPIDRHTWPQKLSPFDLLLISLLMPITLLLRRKFQSAWLRQLCVIFTAAIFIFLLWMTMHIWQLKKASFGIIQSEDIALRTGNAYEFELAFPFSMPVGCEVELLAERGQWSKVRVGQVVGWLPKECLLLPAHATTNP